MPQTLRAYSMTATWKPRQMPRNGTRFDRAHAAALIMPSVPRLPKPPGMRMPVAEQTECHASW
jgi:hypothetical protein